MNLLHQVEAISMDYRSGSRHVIGEFVLKESTHISEYSVQEIADRTFTSKASLVRFAKTLGFAGWKEFSRAFVEEQKHQESHYTDIDPNFPFDKEDSTGDIINKICSLEVESILDTADLLEQAPIDDIVDMLIKAERIAIFGINPNQLLAQMFIRKMLSIGKIVETPGFGDVRLLVSSMSARDCAIIISYSGNTVDKEPLNILSSLKKNEVPIIAITGTGDSILYQNADYALHISSRERLYSKISTFATETSIHYILNIMFSCYFKKEYDRNLKYKLDKGKALEGKIRYSSSLEIGEVFKDV